MTDEPETMVALTDIAQDHAAQAHADEQLRITDNPDQGLYEAKIGQETVAGVLYTRSGGHITLLATSVYPQHRGKGIAGRLLRSVLDDLKAKNETATVSCPFTTSYIQAHPEYRDVVALRRRS